MSSLIYYNYYFKIFTLIKFIYQNILMSILIVISNMKIDEAKKIIVYK